MSRLLKCGERSHSNVAPVLVFETLLHDLPQRLAQPVPLALNGTTFYICVMLCLPPGVGFCLRLITLGPQPLDLVGCFLNFMAGHLLPVFSQRVS
jgi:hypothetical protein